MPKRQRVLEPPAFVLTVEKSGSEGVAGAIGALDQLSGNGERTVSKERAIATQRESALGKMNHNGTHDAPTHGCLHGFPHGDEIGPGDPPRFDATNGANLEIVDDEVIEMRQARRHERSKSVRRNGYRFEIGFKAARARRFEDGDPSVVVTAPGRVHSVMGTRKA